MLRREQRGKEGGGHIVSDIATAKRAQRHGPQSSESESKEPMVPMGDSEASMTAANLRRKAEAIMSCDVAGPDRTGFRRSGVPPGERSVSVCVQRAN